MSQDIDQPVTRDAIEAKLRQIKGEVDTSATAAKPVALMVGVAVAVAVVGLAYVLGRRKGKKKMTLVEVRRI
ncbi:MAG TPA: hypothetical protein VNA57_04990 [Acidimicrobiales bacterium]|nr:hypothetical protein [Acidimicrobiales bacterium]